MTSPIPISSPRLKARIAGLCYLITIGVGAVDHMEVGSRIVVAGDAAATAHNILVSEPIYRLAFVADLTPVYVVVTALLYELFRPVNRSVSLIAAFSSLVGGATGSAIAVFQLAPLFLLGGDQGLRAFDPGQRQALALTFLKLHELGFTISLVFYGFYCLLLGCLIMGSRFMPRFLGLLMAVGGGAYMAYSFTALAAPALAAHAATPAVALGGLGEAALTLWLLLAGVNAARWKDQAAG